MSQHVAAQDMTAQDLASEVIATARAMSAKGLAPGRSGNVSSRSGDGMLITPSGMAYDTLLHADVTAVSFDGHWPTAGRTPSSEWHFHRAIYLARADVAAVVHTHSPDATALACAGHSIPAFHYMVAIAGGREIPLVPYATFGTEALSRHVVGGLAAHNACLLANHGVVAVGSSLARALDLAAGVEMLAGLYCKVLMLGGGRLLDDAEMDRVLAKFATYGQPTKVGG
jgi:L-fuculose-phosphate aldolase